MRPRISRATPVTLIAILAVAAPAATAHAAFSAPETLSEPKTASGYPAIATAPDGSATVAWTAEAPGFRSFVQARRVTPDGSLGPILGLSEPGAEAPVDVGVDAAGTGTVVWSQEGIELARISPAGVAAPSVQIAADPTDEARIRPKVGVAGNGTATVIWKRVSSGHSTLESVLVSPAGEVGAIRQLGSADRMSAPNLAVDGLGRATIVWRVFREPAKRWIVVGARMDREGKIDKLGPISSRSGRNSGEQVAVADSGEATVVWRHYGGRPSVQSAQISEPGKVGQPRILTKGSFNRQYPYFTDARVAYDGRGRAQAAWVRNAGSSRLWSAPLDRSGQAHRPLPVSEPGRRASEPEMAVDAGGSATFVWDSFKNGDEAQVAAERARRGEPTTPQRLSGPSDTALRGRVAIGAREQPLVVWWVLGVPSRVELARGG
jgi:hypothetical protein